MNQNSVGHLQTLLETQLAVSYLDQAHKQLGAKPRSDSIAAVISTACHMQPYTSPRHNHLYPQPVSCS